MSNSVLPTIIRSIVDSRALDASETITLRRWLYGDGIVHRDDIEALFRVNAALGDRNADFSRLLVQAVTDFLVYQEMPTGHVGAADADWLIAMMGGCGGRVLTMGEIETLASILQEAQSVPPDLERFALEQIEHAAGTHGGGERGVVLRFGGDEGAVQAAGRSRRHGDPVEAFLREAARRDGPAGGQAMSHISAAGLA